MDNASKEAFAKWAKEVPAELVAWLVANIGAKSCALTPGPVLVLGDVTYPGKPGRGVFERAEVKFGRRRPGREAEWILSVSRMAGQDRPDFHEVWPS